MISRDAKFVRCVNAGEIQVNRGSGSIPSTVLVEGKIYRVDFQTDFVVRLIGDEKIYFRERFEEVTGKVVECVKRGLWCENERHTEVGEFLEVKETKEYCGLYYEFVGGLRGENKRFKVVQEPISREEQKQAETEPTPCEKAPPRELEAQIEAASLAQNQSAEWKAIKTEEQTEDEKYGRLISVNKTKKIDGHGNVIFEVNKQFVQERIKESPGMVTLPSHVDEEGNMIWEWKTSTEVAKNLHGLKETLEEKLKSLSEECEKLAGKKIKFAIGNKQTIEEVAKSTSEVPGRSGEVSFFKGGSSMSKIASLVRWGFWAFIGISSLVGCLSAIGLVGLVQQWISIDEFQEFVGFLGWGGSIVASRIEQYFPWISGIGGTASVASFGLWVKRNIASWARTALVWGFQVISESKMILQVNSETKTTENSTNSQKGFSGKK